MSCHVNMTGSNFRCEHTSIFLTSNKRFTYQADGYSDGPQTTV